MKIDNKIKESTLKVSEASYDSLNENKSRFNSVIKGIIVIIIGFFIGTEIGGAGKVSEYKHKEIISEYNARIKNLESKEGELEQLKRTTTELNTYLNQ